MKCYYLSLFIAMLFWSCCFADNPVPSTCQKIASKDPNVRYDFCVSALQSDPGSQTATLDQLALISFKLTTAKATAIGSQIESLLKGPSTCQMCLNDCKSLYSDGKDDLDGARKAFTSKDYGTANIKASAALDASSTCEDGFKDKRVTSPLAKEDSDFAQLATITLAFTNMFR